MPRAKTLWQRYWHGEVVRPGDLIEIPAGLKIDPAAGFAPEDAVVEVVKPPTIIKPPERPPEKTGKAEQ